MNDPIKTKICSKCPEKGPQPLDEFHKDTAKPDGLRTVCKTCTLAARAQYREKHPDRVKTAQNAFLAKPGKREEAIVRAREWRAANPGARRNHYWTHREENLQYGRAYRKHFPKKVRETENKYLRTHPEKRFQKNQRRYARMKNAPVIEKVDREIVFARDKGICQLCFKRVDKTLKWPHPEYRTLDHIIPLSEGGNHTYANVVLAHLHCNGRKCDGSTIPQQIGLF